MVQSDTVKAARLTAPRMVMAMVLLAFAAGVAAYLASGDGDAADLKALWLAGRFWDMGQPGQIYPPADGLFTMRPPAAWAGFLGPDEGGQVFPFLYPPLWAVVMGALTGPDFAPVAFAAVWINAGLLAMMVVLAIRATGAALDPLFHAVLVLLVFTLTQVASLPLMQGQPHILVAFLLVLTVERSRAGAELTAGAALALAASIKLFPLVCVLIWIGRRQYRALAAFVAVGAALGGLSVLLAGWPLHRAFLDTIAQIGRTLLVTGRTVSFDAVVGQIFLADRAQQVFGGTVVPELGLHEYWLVIARPALWGTVANLMLGAVLIGLAVAARRASTAGLYSGIWPLALTVSALFVPTGWLYYLLPAAAFAPGLIARLPPARGAALFLIGLLFLWGGRSNLVQGLDFVPVPAPFVFVAGAMAWALGFGLAARRDPA